MSCLPQPSPHRTAQGLFLSFVAAAAMLAGCTASPPTPDREPAVTAPPSAAPPPPAVDLSAQTVSVDVARRMILQSRGSEPVAYLLVERSAPAPDSAGATSWNVRRSVGPTPDGPWTLLVEQTFVLTTTGDAALAGETNHAEEVGLAFTPPMVVMPARLPAGGELFSQDTKLRVWPLANPRQTKAQGPVRQRIVHNGGEFIDAPSGPMQAQRVTQTFEATLNPAAVRNITRQWFVPGLGLIAEEREERTRVFGVQTRLNRESWVLLSAP